MLVIVELLDRIDPHVEVPAVPCTQLAEAPPGPTSADLIADVLRARARQAERFGPRGPGVNGRMTPRQVRKHCPLKKDSMSLLKAAMEELGLSARAHERCSACEERWPTWKAPIRSSHITLLRRSDIERSIGVCGRE